MTTKDSEPVDVLIIGAGASGGVVARRLAEAGIGVLCLEQGDWHDRMEYRGAELDWELTARKQWSGSPNVRGLPEDYPVDDADSDISPLMFAGVGGSMLLFAGAWPRLLPSDFRVRTLDGVADDWPLTYDELQPYYERSDRQIGVSGLGGDPAYPPGEDPPLPPLPIGAGGAEGRPGPQPTRLALVAGTQRDPLGALRRSQPVRPAGHVHAGLQRGREGLDRPDPLAAGDRQRRPARHRRPGRAARDERPRPRHRVRRGSTDDGREHFQAASVVVLAANAHRHRPAVAAVVVDAPSRRPRQLERPRRAAADDASVRQRDRPVRRGSRELAGPLRVLDRVVRVLRDRRAARVRSRRQVGPGADGRSGQRRPAEPGRRAGRGARPPPPRCAPASGAAPAGGCSARICPTSRTR